MFWLKEGDENRKFFHANASARRKANRVSLLMTDDGSRVDDKMGMSELVLNFFKTVLLLREKKLQGTSYLVLES